MHTTPSSHPRRARLWMAAALTALACSAQADEATIRKTLAERIPQLAKIDEVRPTSMPGLFEVRKALICFTAMPRATTSSRAN